MKSRTRDVAFALSVLALGGCSGAHGARAEPVLASGARVASSPTDLLSEDLDFVIRVDVARLREDAVLAAVVRDAARKTGTALLDDVGRALDGSSAVYVGGRWMEGGFQGDGVIAIESRDAEQSSPEDVSREASMVTRATSSPRETSTERASNALREPTVPTTSNVLREASRAKAGDGWIESQEASRPDVFRRLSTGPRDVEIFERSARGRGDAALKVTFPGRGVVLATTAEVDAVLRILRSGSDRERLDPPARGVISFAGRASAFLASREEIRMADLAACAAGLRAFSGTVDPGDAIGVELTLEYVGEEQRSQGGACLKSLIERLSSIVPKLRSLSDSTRLTEVGRSVRVEAKIPLAWLAATR